MSTWIKFRTSLINHPKVVKIAWTIRGTDVDKTWNDRGQNVTNVSTTLGALIQTWCMADVHADGECLSNMSLDTLDMLVGVPGFAQAMVNVGWLDEREGSLYLPNYQEHNGPTAKRRAIKSKSMRQGRKDVEQTWTKRGLDVDKTWTDESTKREKENKNKEPNGSSPIVPKKPVEKFDPITQAESPFDSEEWRTAWEMWCRHRQELKKPLTPQATKALIADLGSMGEARAIAAIRHSIRGGWQGIFEPKAESAYAPRPTAIERAAETAERLITGKSSIANQIFAELQALGDNT